MWDCFERFVVGGSGCDMNYSRRKLQELSNVFFIFLYLESGAARLAKQC